MFMLKLWFFCYLVAVFFIDVMFTSNGTKKQLLYTIATLCGIALIVLAILGIFWAEKWWYGLAGLVLAKCLSGLIYPALSGLFMAIFKREHEDFNLICLLIGIILTPIATVVAYYSLLFHH